jgi:hypothetical protein
MEVILNIGLAVNATPTLAAHVALEIVKANGMLVKKSKVFQSDTEPTLVATVIMTGLDSVENTRTLHQTAVDLQQDCIAVYSPHVAFGALVGPRAALWGAFNPELFIMPDGTRLSQPAQQVAA